MDITANAAMHERIGAALIAAYLQSCFIFVYLVLTCVILNRLGNGESLLFDIMHAVSRRHRDA